MAGVKHAACVAWSPDGRFLTYGWADIVHVYNTATSRVCWSTQIASQGLKVSSVSHKAFEVPCEQNDAGKGQEYSSAQNVAHTVFMSFSSSTTRLHLFLSYKCSVSALSCRNGYVISSVTQHCLGHCICWLNNNMCSCITLNMYLRLVCIMESAILHLSRNTSNT